MSLKNGRLVWGIAVVWMACAILVCVQPFLWHVRFFSTVPGYAIIQAIPAMLALLAFAYLRLRRGRLWRFEPFLLATPFLLVVGTHPKSAFVVFVMGGAAYLVGRLVTRQLALELGEAPVALAVGFGVLILMLYVLGKLGLFYPPVFIGLLAALLIAGSAFWKDLVQIPRLVVRTWRESPDLGSPWVGLAVLFALVFAGSSALVMLTPVMAFDVLDYHFPLAQLYARDHRLEPMPAITQSYYPQGAGVLLTMAFSLDGQYAAQLVTPAFYVLFLWLALRLARDCGASRSAAVFGVVAAGTLPFLHWTGSVPKDDMLLAVFQIASLYCFIQWQKARGFAWMVTAAFFAGQSFGIKHVALFGFVPLILLFAYAVWRQPRRWRAALIVLLVFAASGLFWQLETFLRTGKPVYPAGVQSAASAVVHQHSSLLWQYGYRYATLPWYLFFNGTQAFESPSPNPLGMFVILFAPIPFLIWRARWTAPMKACALFTGLYLAYWSSMMSSLRYAIVPFTLVVMAVGAGLLEFVKTAPFSIRLSLLFGCFFTFVFALFSVMTFEVNIPQVSYLLRSINSEGYLKLALPTTPALFRVRDLEPGASVFGVENCSRFYAPDPPHFGCMLCSEPCTLDGLRQKLNSGRYRFAVLPSRPQYRAWHEAIMKTFGGIKVYEDAHFCAYRLDGLPQP